MKTLTQAQPILDSISVLHDTQAALIKELDTSLYIQSIWKHAFLNGSSCTVRIGARTGHEWDEFLQGRLEIKSAFLFRMDDGNTFPLTASQFRKLHFARANQS